MKEWLEKRTAGFRISELTVKCIIWKNNSVAFRASGFHFDEFKPGSEARNAFA
jgi:hypothetical protein